MDPQIVLDLLQEAFQIALLLSLPVMVTTLVVGVTISIFQSITSIQEQTLVFVPKIVAVLVAVIVCFSWMMNTVLTYTRDLFTLIPDLIR